MYSYACIYIIIHSIARHMRVKIISAGGSVAWLIWLDLHSFSQPLHVNPVLQLPVVFLLLPTDGMDGASSRLTLLAVLSAVLNPALSGLVTSGNRPINNDSCTCIYTCHFALYNQFFCTFISRECACVLVPD